VQTGREVARVYGLKRVATAAFSPDGRSFVTATEDGPEFWETSFGSDALRVDSGGPVLSLSVSPVGEWVVTGGKDGIRVFKTDGLRLVERPGDAVEVTSLVFSADGRWMAALSGDSVTVFDTVAHWAVVKKLVHPAEVNGIGFSPDGRWLITVSGETVKLFAAGSWVETHTMKHTDPVQAVYFSPDGRRFMARTKESYRMHHKGDFREESYVWNATSGLPIACKTETGQPVTQAEEGTTPDAEVICADVKGAGRGALLSEASHWNNTIRLTGGPVTSADGLWRVEDGELKFREGNGFRRVASFPQPETLSAPTFTADSRWLVVAGYNEVALWPLKRADMMGEACSRLQRRDLTDEERKRYISDGETQPTCPAAH
jgi:WD40 repeat protein